MNKLRPDIFITEFLYQDLLEDHLRLGFGDESKPSQFLLDFHKWVSTKKLDDEIKPNGLFGKHVLPSPHKALHHVHMTPFYDDSKRRVWNDAYKRWSLGHSSAVPTSDRCLLFAYREEKQEFLIIDHVSDAPPGAHHALWGKDSGSRELIARYEKTAMSFRTLGGDARRILSYQQACMLEIAAKSEGDDESKVA